MSYFIQETSKRYDNIKQLKFYKETYRELSKSHSKQNNTNLSKWLYSFHLNYRDKLVSEYSKLILWFIGFFLLCIIFFSSFNKPKSYGDIIAFYLAFILIILSHYKELKSCHKYNDFGCIYRYKFIQKN